MRTYWGWIKSGWLGMLEPPWHGLLGPNQGRYFRWLYWAAGWAWVLAGMVQGAVVAPSLVQRTGLANTQYYYWLVIGVALLAGFLAQLLGWLLMWPISYLLLVALLPVILVAIFVSAFVIRPGVSHYYSERLRGRGRAFGRQFGGPAQHIAVVVPIAGIGYGIYRYLAGVGPDQRSVTIAFVVYLLVKTFVIPAIWGAIKSNTFKIVKDWLRGDKVKAKGA